MTETAVSRSSGAADAARRRARSMPGIDQVTRICASLVGTQVVTSVLGLLYWALAARQTSVAAVGLAGAAIALMQLLGTVGMLGLGTLLMAELPKLGPHPRRLIVRTSLSSAAVASGALGLIAAVGFAMLHGSSLSVLGRPVNAADFVLGTALTGTTMVLDQAVLVVGADKVQLGRNTVSSVAKIAALLGLTVLGRTGGMDIFLAWTIGNLVSLPYVLHRTRVPRRPRPSRRLVDLRLMRRMAGSAASHHALNLMLQAPILLLSVVVAVVLTAQDNGYFSTARSLAGFVFMLPFSVTIALFAAAAGREADLLAKMKLTIPFGFAVSIAADLILWPLGPTVLNIFGHAYSVDALATLRVLVLAGVPFVIKDHFVALRRVQNRTGNAALAALVGAVLEVVAATVGAKVGGTVGLCTFWVATLTLEAAVLGVVLWRVARTTQATSHPVPNPTADLPLPSLVTE